MLPVAQLASVCGVWGLSALVALVNAALVLLVFDRARVRWWLAAAASFAVLATAAWGSARLRDSPLTREGVALRVGLVQGNVSQDQKWNQARAGSIVQDYLELTRRAAAEGARFILWPESALPFFFEEEPVVGAAVRQVARRDRRHAARRQRPDRQDAAGPLLQRRVPD